MFAKDKSRLQFTLNKPYCKCSLKCILCLVSLAPKMLSGNYVVFVTCHWAGSYAAVVPCLRYRALILCANQLYVVSCLRYKARILSDSYPYVVSC
jgi:hypothetical protein